MPGEVLANPIVVNEFESAISVPELSNNQTLNILVTALDSQHITSSQRIGQRHAAHYETVTTWLKEKLDRSNLEQSLEILEASTASSILGSGVEALDEAFGPIALASLRRIGSEAEAQGLDEEQALSLIQSRIFRVDEERVIPVQSFNLKSPENQAAIKQRYTKQRKSSLGNLLEKSAGMDTNSFNYRVYEKLLGAPTEDKFTISLLRQVEPANRKDVEKAIKLLNEVDVSKLQLSVARTWSKSATTIFVDMLSRYKDRSHNAATLFNSLTKDYEKSGLKVGAFNLIALANRVRTMQNREKITGKANELMAKLPEAIDDLTTLITDFGENDFSKDEKLSIRTYGKLLSDLLIISQQGMKSSKMSESTEADNTTYANLSSQLGSVVFWNKWNPGGGIFS